MLKNLGGEVFVPSPRRGERYRKGLERLERSAAIEPLEQVKKNSGVGRHSKALRALPALIAIATVAFVGGCSRSDREVQAKPAPGTIVLAGAGATFPSVFYNRLIDVYHQSHPKVLITYAAVGSGEGVRRFIGKNVSDGERVDFGASDAAMSDTEIASTGNDALMVPASAGCVVLAYNLPGFNKELRLSRQAYSRIFLGEITKWNHPLIAKANPGVKLPNLTITIVVRQDSSGTTFAFTKHLDAINDSWRNQFGPGTLIDWPGNAMRAKGNEGIAGRVGASEGAIGYVGYEFARKLGLRTAALENKDGKFVKPTIETCGAALAGIEMPENLRVFVPDPKGVDAYPIVTFSWILLRKSYQSATATALRDFFQWSLGEGQSYSAELGYIPVPASVAEKALIAVDSIKAKG
jgi:phosphate transport system substrate-binding protein